MRMRLFFDRRATRARDELGRRAERLELLGDALERRDARRFERTTSAPTSTRVTARSRAA
jgi:hypothetical protein